MSSINLFLLFHFPFLTWLYTDESDAKYENNLDERD